MALIKPKAKTGGSPAAKAGQSRFQYKPRTPEQVRERAQRAVGGRDSFFNSEVQFFTPRVGDNNVRILPPPPDADWGHYGLNLTVHYGIGADQSAYLCRNKMLGEACPICEERERAASAGEEDLADDLRPNQRVAVYVIDRAQEGKGPLLWNLPAGLDKDIIKLCIDPSSGEVLPVDDPNDGYDLNFTREGEGLKTKYKGIQFSRKPSPLADDPDVAEEWLQHIVDHRIDNCLQYFEYDYMEKVLAGQAPATHDDGDDKPTKPAAKAPSTKAPAKPAAPAGRAKIQPRGKPAPDPEPEDLPPAGAPDGFEPPTWDELQELDEDGLAAVGEAAELEFPEEGFEDLEELRTFIAQRLGLQPPKPEPKAAGGWRDRLAALKGKK